MNTFSKICACMMLVGLYPLTTDAQTKDAWKEHPNNVKFNVSSGLIYKNAIIFGYERSVGPHQTFSVFGGLQQLPSFGSINVPGVEIQKENKNNGFNFGGDYRFYLASENKHAVPHGLYIGPYASYYSFRSDNTAHFTFDDGTSADGTLNAKFNVVSLGGQLGYQFVFWNRMSLDLILFGPSLTHYFGALNVSSNVDPANVSEEIKKVLTALGDRYPVIGDAIKNGSTSGSGHLGIWGAGFRYSVHVGLRI